MGFVPRATTVWGLHWHWHVLGAELDSKVESAIWTAPDTVQGPMYGFGHPMYTAPPDPIMPAMKFPVKEQPSIDMFRMGEAPTTIRLTAPPCCFRKLPMDRSSSTTVQHRIGGGGAREEVTQAVAAWQRPLVVAHAWVGRWCVDGIEAMVSGWLLMGWPGARVGDDNKTKHTVITTHRNC